MMFCNCVFCSKRIQMSNWKLVEYSAIYGLHQYWWKIVKHLTNSFLPTIGYFSNFVCHFQWISRPRLVFDEYTAKFCSFNKSMWSRISTVPWPLPFRSIIIGNYQCHCHTHWSVIGDYKCHWREPVVPASINNRSQGRGVALKLKLFWLKSSFFSRYFASH